jgi:hypothetical protein
LSFLRHRNLRPTDYEADILPLCHCTLMTKLF